MKGKHLQREAFAWKSDHLTRLHSKVRLIDTPEPRVDLSWSWGLRFFSPRCFLYFSTIFQRDRMFKPISVVAVYYMYIQVILKVRGLQTTKKVCQNSSTTNLQNVWRDFPQIQQRIKSRFWGFKSQFGDLSRGF